MSKQLQDALGDKIAELRDALNQRDARIAELEFADSESSKLSAALELKIPETYGAAMDAAENS